MLRDVARPRRLLFLLLIFLLACSLPMLQGAPTPAPVADVAFTQTALVLQQTQAALSLTLQAPSATPVPPPTALPSPTTLPSSPTPAVPPTATLVPPTATLMPSGIQGTAIGNLYCRTGPAPYYPAIDSMTAGDQVSVLARSSEENNYWLVKTPRGNTCWVWGRWLEIHGDTATLTIATAPPPPPAAASIALLRQDTCSGSYNLVFSIINRGPVPIESLRLQVKDDKGHLHSNLPAWGDVFRRCGGSLASLPAHQETEVWIPTGNVDLRGRMVQVMLTTCTKDGLKGECIERTPFNVSVP